MDFDMMIITIKGENKLRVVGVRKLSSFPSLNLLGGASLKKIIFPVLGQRWGCKQLLYKVLPNLINLNAALQVLDFHNYEM